MSGQCLCSWCVEERLRARDAADLRGLAAYDQARHSERGDRVSVPHRHPECAHVLDGPVTSRRFRAVDGRTYLATEATCRKCGERLEKCMLRTCKPGLPVGDERL